MQKKVNLKIEKVIISFAWFTLISELPDPSNAAHSIKIIVSFKWKNLLNIGRIINNPVDTKTLKKKLWSDWIYYKLKKHF